ncbi:type II secretion system protein [Gimesia aquarii]|uniref:Major pilin subunit n=1 Tax=Gimesia aquarii TaxID=2527964 RepID=A0A517X307_9PLAN|nr:prepilin-type N-terminal cleavage/methylation domain-containing protein [Gimesia aquarii]QDU11896.1 hypothetical protein V202x_53210 [Gimesia aquarii]
MLIDHRSRRAFTLIELLVAISILALLIALRASFVNQYCQIGSTRCGLG